MRLIDNLRNRSDRSRPAATGQGRTPASLPLRWADLAVDTVGDHPTMLADIAARRFDGITVSGVFSKEECDHAIATMAQHTDEMTPATFGPMLGTPLAELARDPDATDRSSYYDQAERARARQIEAFGFDPFERVAAALQPMAGDLTVTTPTEDGRRYQSGNVRWMEPGRGGLKAHVGNEFALQGDWTTAHLRDVTRIRDHYSWFVVLQPPEQGGALSVFDLLYESHRPADPTWGATGRDDADFDDLPARKVAPAAGTLVCFGGGWRWHRVDKIEGAIPRVTFGGFAGPSTDGRAIHAWF